MKHTIKIELNEKFIVEIHVFRESELIFIPREKAGFSGGLIDLLSRAGLILDKVGSSIHFSIKGYLANPIPDLLDRLVAESNGYAVIECGYKEDDDWRHFHQFSDWLEFHGFHVLNSEHRDPIHCFDHLLHKEG